jgi:6-pyruvoyltetrahydropterin/6-carboxytetrahydropterin synthase
MTVHLSRRYGFFASHRLHEPRLSDEQNRELFGKCNNPHGHGHNYEVEVTLSGRVDEITGRAVDLPSLDRLCERELLAPFRYRNLNIEMNANPTTENLTDLMMRRLGAAWNQWFTADGPKLEKIRVWETERNICEVVAQK